jgi:hypothetical protein
MILSVSRRTDIPAFYSSWFYQRIKDGYVEVRNPMNTHQVSKIELSPDIIECIVFWTKNPSKDFIENLKLLDDFGYTYYFQFTVTAYDETIERNVPEKKQIMQTFRNLSEKIGKEKVLWRYDPVFMNEKYTLDYHCKYFDYIASKLGGYTDKCIISFIDSYSRIKKRLEAQNINGVTPLQMLSIGELFSSIAREYNIKIETCCESIDLKQYGIEKGHCIDGELINKITNKQYLFRKDATQRKECGCITSIDIGSYNTCHHNCLYCYANWIDTIDKNMIHCDPNSPLLCSELKPDDKVTNRKIALCPLEEEELFNK